MYPTKDVLISLVLSMSGVPLPECVPSLKRDLLMELLRPYHSFGFTAKYPLVIGAVHRLQAGSILELVTGHSVAFEKIQFVRPQDAASVSPTTPFQTVLESLFGISQQTEYEKLLQMFDQSSSFPNMGDAVPSEIVHRSIRPALCLLLITLIFDLEDFRPKLVPLLASMMHFIPIGRTGDVWYVLAL